MTKVISLSSSCDWCLFVDMLRLCIEVGTKVLTIPLTVAQADPGKLKT